MRRETFQPRIDHTGTTPERFTRIAVDRSQPATGFDNWISPNVANDTLDIDLNGQPVLVTSASLPNLDWILSIVIPFTRSQPSRRTWPLHSTATVSSQYKTPCLQWRFSLWQQRLYHFFEPAFYSGPIAQMLERRTLHHIGRFDVSVPVTSNDELGELAASFNQMTR